MTIEEFYRDNYRIVYGYLLSLSGNAAVAEELASETFLRALQKPPHDQGACKPSTWLCAIAKNLYFSELRRQKRRVPFPEAAPQDTVPFEEQLVDRETARSLLRVAKELREPYRQVFFLRLSRLPFREIGDAAGKTESWARVTFFRAKAMILSELEETP